MSWYARFTRTLGTLELDLELSSAGEHVALIGPNGSGKTTLLRMMAGAYPPQSGQFTLGTRALVDTEADLVLPPEERGVAYVPQGFALFPHLNVIDNLAFARVELLSKHARRVRAQGLLSELGAGHLAGSFIQHLSSGEAQKVALARALIRAPKLLLLDEPLAAMDAQVRRSMRAYLSEQLASKGIVSVIVTHDARDVLALNAKVYALEKGKVVQEGSAAELSDRPATPFIAEFFNSPQHP